MLDQIKTFYQADLEKLANNWLAAGAECFGMQSVDQATWKWPADAAFDTGCNKTVRAPIYAEEQICGELFVAGMPESWVAAQLESNAVFVSRLITQEHDLETLTQELVDNQDQLVALYDLLHSTRNLVSVSEIVEGIVHAAGKIFDVSTVFIRTAFIGREPGGSTYPQPIPELLTMTLMERTLSELDYLLFSCSTAADPILSEHIDTALAIPLKIQGQPLAILGLIDKKHGEFESPDIKLLKAIGEYAESEIENALMHEANVEQVKIRTRMQTEMELAHGVQMNLMPQTLPEFPTLDLAAKAIPALSVGGDFYDCLVQSDEQFYFTLGDVSGKGMPAALLMAMTRTTLRNAARLLHDSMPRVILDRTTDALYDDFTEVGMFSTVFVGTYLPQKGELHYANAGHAPVIFKPVGGKARLLEATGPPLGAWPDNLAEESFILFGEGDVLVAATDGLNEARNDAGEMFDYERLLHLVDEITHQTSAEIMESLMSAVAEFSKGQPQDDDQTIIVLKRCKG
ncbi:MAG: PP2C family protein-serine/threonine phosphatase [Anaerolineae bacterium]